jgi:serine/threonine-protein kinase
MPPVSSGLNVAISPDGSHIVYSGMEGMFLRSLAQASRTLARWEGTANSRPFFSPDGEWVAYFKFETGELRRVALAGGSPIVVADLGFRHILGGSWGADDRIVVATERGLYRVPASGGAPELLVAPEPAREELRFVEPEILPGGRPFCSPWNR